MNLQKISFSLLVTLLTTVLTPLLLNWTTPFSKQQVLAQTPTERKAEADRLLKQGNQQDETGRSQAAIQSFQQALAIYRKIGARNAEAGCLYNLGNAYNSLGQDQKAIQFFQQSLEIQRQIGDRRGESWSVGNLGIAYAYLGEYQQAIQFLKQQLDITREIGDHQSEATTLYNLGNAYSILRQHQQAIQSWQQALVNAREIHNRRLEKKILRILGVAYNDELKDHARAIEYYQQSLTIAREDHDRDAEGRTLGGLGNAYASLNNYAKAIDYYQQWLTIAREIKDRQSEIATLIAIGNTYLLISGYAKAIQSHQQVLAITREIHDRKAEAEALGSLGNYYFYIGNYAKAIKYAQQSLTIAREIKDRKGEGQALGNLGAVYDDIGDHAKGIDYAKQRLTIAWEIKDREGEGQALANLGNAYDNIGDHAKAIDYVKQRLTIAREIKDRRGEAIALGNLGNAYDNIGDHTKAVDYYQQSLTIAREIKDLQGQAFTLSNLGTTLFESGKLVEAERILRAGIQIFDSLRLGLDDTDKVSIFERQARSYRRLQQVLIAQSKAKAALEIAERGRARAFVELLAARLSPTSDAQSLMAPPKTQLLQQIAKEQNAVLVEYSIIYNDFKVQGRQQKHESELFIWVIKPTGEAAFRRVDLKPLWQQKDTSLTKLAPNSPIVIPAAPNSPDVVTPAAESEQELTRPWQQPIAIALIILTTGSIIGIAIWGGRFFLTKKAAQNSNLKQRWLVPSLLLILAVGSGGGLFLWMTRSQAIAQNPNLRNNSLLAELVDSTRESIGTKGRGLGIVSLGQKASQGDRLKQLHQILIQPIADLLPTDPNARVIFIPQSSLFLVPFPALQDESGKYLIEKHTILTAPSIQVLSLTHQRRQRVGAIHELPLQGKDALIVGNPTMPKVPPQIGETPQQLSSLPGAEEEAKSIAALLKTQVLTGERATKNAVLQKMSTARIVHLATHGILDERQALNSAIALAPDPPPYKEQIGEINGLLTAKQILNLKLNAELVVLSACDTGKGRITGDGVVGLSRSLISAGVPSVIVSLWSVPDAPTAELMTQFYRNLLLHPDKAQALRGAMLATMKKHPNPIDWAAFTLIGEAN